jgi:hypothetical protein
VVVPPPPLHAETRARETRAGKGRKRSDRGRMSGS